MKLRNNLILLIIVIPILLIILFLRKCDKHIKQEFNEPKKENPIRVIQVDSNTKIHLQEAELLKKDQMIFLLKQENSRLKNAVAVVKGDIETKIDSFFVPYQDTLSDSNKITVPKRFSKITDFYTITGEVTKKGVAFDTTQMKLGLMVGFGYAKPASLSEVFRPRIHAEVKTTNPDARVTRLSTYYLSQKTPWYQKKGVWFAVGVLVGTGSILYLSH